MVLDLLGSSPPGATRRSTGAAQAAQRRGEGGSCRWLGDWKRGVGSCQELKVAEGGGVFEDAAASVSDLGGWYMRLGLLRSRAMVEDGMETSEGPLGLQPPVCGVIGGCTPPSYMASVALKKG